MEIQGLPPVHDAHATVLILGTMPGEESLCRREYYASPRNAFWDLMGEVVGATQGLPYQARCAVLVRFGIALWDVAQSCGRVGSDDSSIRGATPNDLPGFARDHRHLRAVSLNGTRARDLYASFHRYDAALQGLDVHVLPSTSRANTHLTRDEKLAQWRVVLRYTRRASARP